MHFNSYDYQTGQLIESTASLNFGDIIQNQHCSGPIVLKVFPTVETDASNLLFYLVDKGPWKDSEFGFYTDSTFSVIETGSDLFVHMEEGYSHPNAGKPVHWNGTSSDFIWVDAQIHNVTGSSEPLFRLTYDFN